MLLSVNDQWFEFRKFLSASEYVFGNIIRPLGTSREHFSQNSDSTFGDSDAKHDSKGIKYDIMKTRNFLQSLLNSSSINNCNCCLRFHETIDNNTMNGFVKS